MPDSSDLNYGGARSAPLTSPAFLAAILTAFLVMEITLAPGRSRSLIRTDPFRERSSCPGFLALNS